MKGISHARILQAIKDRNPFAAQSVMYDHLYSSKMIYKRHMDKLKREKEEAAGTLSSEPCPVICKNGCARERCLSRAQFTLYQPCYWAKMLFLIWAMAFFSRRETCAWEIFISLATSICVLPS